MNKKQKRIVFFAVIIAIICIIFLIDYVKSNNHIDEKTIICIANNSKLFVSRTCRFCAEQKQILGNYTDYFEIIDCAIEKDTCALNGIEGVPTWIINNEKYLGKKTLKELKTLTNC